MATRPTLTRAVAKTKNTAKAYNDNFDAMMDFVDDSVTESKNYVDGYMPSQTGQEGKFLTTNGTTASWVNVGGDFPYSKYIDGLAITKVNNNTISVAVGSCFDSTGVFVITLGTATNKQNASQAASSTYYVYVISNGTTTDVAIDSSSSIPTLPTGYTYYRNIGSYTTNSSGNIDVITSLSNTATLSSKISATKGGRWVKLSNGLIIQWGSSAGFGNGTTKTLTFPTPFSTTELRIAGSTGYQQTAGDKGSSWAVTTWTKTTVTIRSEFGQDGSNHSIHYIAIGF